ncbi:chemotaxis protein CheW [Phormidesmis sp. 146-35]
MDMSDQALSLDWTIATNHESGLSRLEGLFEDEAIVEVGQKFLRFRLCSDQDALLPVDEVAAVLTLQTQDVLPVPHMPDCVLGIYNWRGEVLWLVDLAHQVGLDALVKQNSRLTSCMAIVLQVNGQFLGLAVPDVYDIEPHDPQLLQPPLSELFSPKLLPFVKGYLTGADRQSTEDQRSTVLEVTAILQDPRLHLHQLN